VPRIPKLEPWERNLYAVATAQFIALAGANLVIPFMPFYVRDLGVESDGAVALWSGLLTTATGVALFVSSPLWGSLADRYGRKPLLLRAYAGAMITMTLQGVATEVWGLLILRLLQGAFVGTIPAATALVASGTPRVRVAYALGILQMGLFLSQTVGPLVGGILAPTIGIRPTFFFTGALYSLSFLLVLTQVQERFERPGVSERGSVLGNLRLVMAIRPLLVLIALVFFLNCGAAFVRPVVPLLVESFESSINAETLSGIAFASLAVSSAFAALMASRVSSRLGYRNALALATFGAGAAYIPVALASNELSLIVLFAFVGLFSGAMVPTANVLIDGWAPSGRQAAAFGLAGSALALAIAVAPLTGGAVAAAFGTNASFIVIGCVMLCVGLGVLAFVREPNAGPDPLLVQAEAGD